jgi:hypothetical protein
MIRWYEIESKASGFAYYPLLEIAVGIFLMICALVVPILFLIYNGIKLEQWGELLFCALFFLLFSFMGKNLTFQYLKVEQSADQITFYQNLREPPVEITVETNKLSGLTTKETKEGDETFIVLNLKLPEEKEFYRSVNRKEIKKISEAIIALGRMAKEEK